MKRYTVERYSATDRWIPIIGASAVSLDYCKGYVCRELESYPCRKLRIVEFGTDNIVQEFKENYAVKLA